MKILYQPQLSSTHCSRTNQPPSLLVFKGRFLFLAIVSVHVVYGIQGKAAGLNNTDQLIKGFAWTSPLLGICFSNYYALTIQFRNPESSDVECCQTLQHASRI